MRHYLRPVLAIPGLALGVLPPSVEGGLVPASRLPKLSPARGRPTVVAAVGVAAITAATQEKPRLALPTCPRPKLFHRPGEQRGTRRDQVAGPSLARDDANPPRGGLGTSQAARLVSRPVQAQATPRSAPVSGHRSARAHPTGRGQAPFPYPSPGARPPTNPRFHALFTIDAAHFPRIASTQSASLALSVIGRLDSSGVRTAGFVQRKSRNERGEKRYDLERLHSPDRAVLAIDGVAAKGPNEEFFCSMAVHNDGFVAAGRWIEEDAAGADVLLIDEISKLETAGKGHAATFQRVLQRDDALVLFCVRASELFYVLERFALPDETMVAAIELPATDEVVGGFVDALEKSCHAQRANR